MQTRFPILNGPYLGDLLSQPRALADTVAALQTLSAFPTELRQCQKIVLTGMGSSLHALHPLLLRLVRAGLTVMMIETAELVYAQADLLDENTLVVAVSQSGRSAETTLLLGRIASMTKRPHVIGVTNTDDSPLAYTADFVVPLKAGPEFSVSCKTYLATLVALDWLGAALTGEDLSTALNELAMVPEAVKTYFGAGSDYVAALVERFPGLGHLFLTGRGASLAAVHTGALILKESTRFHAEGMSSPAFRHGPLEMVRPGLFALVFAGGYCKTASLNERLVQDIMSAGGDAVLVGPDAAPGVFRLPIVPARLLPVVEMLPVQMMSLALAVLAGREPGVFERATKITDTE